MRAATLSRARRVFSRSADRAALPRSPPCPRSLSVRADACDDDAQRVVCDPSPPPRARPSAAHRDRRRSQEADDISPKDYTLPRVCAPNDPCPWPGRSPPRRAARLLLGCGEKSKLLAARASWRGARSAGRGARRSPHAHSHAARCSSPLVRACIFLLMY